MKLVILTLTLITAVIVNCRDRIKPPEPLLSDEDSKLADLIHFETLVGMESTLKSSKDMKDKFQERTKCKPSKRCIKANGKCGYKKWCKGRIIRNGCKEPTGCGNTICCAPTPTTPIVITTAAPTTKEALNTKKPTTTVVNGTDDPPPTTPIVITTAAPTTKEALNTKKPTTTVVNGTDDPLDPCTLIGGTTVAGECLIINEDSKTWSEAKVSCETKSQRLAVLQDPVVVNAYLQNNYGGERFWLGSSDRDNEGTWTWINGQSLAGFPWGPSQPDDNNSNEDCLEWGYRNNYNDAVCTNALPYICEPVDPCTLIGGTTVAGECLIINEDSKTWSEAKVSCETKSQRLAVLQDPVVVNAYLQNNYGGERFWLGGSDRDNEGTWTWINGQSLAGFPWGPSQPDDNNSNEDCLEWGYRNNYNDAVCTNALPYICEPEASSSR